MQERNINLEGIDPVELYGVNDAKLEKIKGFFPKLKIVGRGDLLKVIGDADELVRFDKKFGTLMDHLKKHNRITDVNIDTLLNGKDIFSDDDGKNIILFGNKGLKITARTANQLKIVHGIEKNDMQFVIGPAGTGKTYTSVALAVRALKNKEVRKIVLTRPAVEAGENLGFLPGDLKEKLDPYLQPLYDALRDMIPSEKLVDFMASGVIQIAPLAFMRGRTLDNAFVILDEAQNATESQMKMFLTRMGRSAKFVITGDVTQVDLPKHQPSGLFKALAILKKVKGVNIVELQKEDVIRHALVSRIIQAYDDEENS